MPEISIRMEDSHTESNVNWKKKNVWPDHFLEDSAWNHVVVNLRARGVFVTKTSNGQNKWWPVLWVQHTTVINKSDSSVGNKSQGSWSCGNDGFLAKQLWSLWEEAVMRDQSHMTATGNSVSKRDCSNCDGPGLNCPGLNGSFPNHHLQTIAKQSCCSHNINNSKVVNNSAGKKKFHPTKLQHHGADRPRSRSKNASSLD